MLIIHGLLLAGASIAIRFYILIRQDVKKMGLRVAIQSIDTTAVLLFAADVTTVLFLLK